MSASLKAWALPRINRLLPIDDESLGEIINYTASLSKDAGAEHLKNLLGDSGPALEFITAFNSRREYVTPASSTASRTHTPQHTDSEAAPSPQGKRTKKPRAPLHSAGPVRQPEGYGNLAGSYQKSYGGNEHWSGPGQPGPSGSSLSAALSLSQEPSALQVPKTSQTRISYPSKSRDVSPGHGRQKLPPSAAGNLISEFMPNVRAKQVKKPGQSFESGSSTPRSQHVTTTTANLQDLTAAIAALEVATNPSMSTERRHCDCNASLHPLFETAPNCLSCGKIICALEGLQPCSYCDAPILTKEQVSSMIRALKDERGVERMATHNAGVASGRGTPIFAGSTPESSGDEASSAASRARAHRDKLLAFQRENAQRTRIHDEAADYDTSLTPGTTQWMSPVQRAAALKKQQMYMRELQEASRPEWEKKKTVMSMSIKNGKLVKTYGREKVSAPFQDNTTDTADETPEDEHEHQHLTSGSGAFSKNPLLASGKLIRPIWKAQDDDVNDRPGSEEQSSNRTRRSVWRRVQDDHEDNEQWILDGGLHGYGTKAHLMEDGSQQECG